jgi:hypothetical protein
LTFPGGALDCNPNETQTGTAGQLAEMSPYGDGARMMSTKQAERCAAIGWETVKRLMASEAAAQAAMAGTDKDFEIFAVEFLTEAFVLGRPPELTKRTDATARSAKEWDDGNHYFDFDKIDNLEEISYVQGLMALQQSVPQELRLKYKQLHAHGATPWQAYSEVMREWEKSKAMMCDDATPAAAVAGDTHVTDAEAKRILKSAPLSVQAAYNARRSKGITPAEALEDALRQWRGAA